MARTLLSGAIALHLAALGAEVAPTHPTTLQYLPGWLRPPVATLLPVTDFVSERTSGYLDVLLMRQSWDLFGPDPVAWSQSIELTTYYPRPGPAPDSVVPAPDSVVPAPDGEEGRGGGGASDRALGSMGPESAWVALRALLPGAAERPLPHWLDRREDRVLHNLGSPGWESYVPVLGAYLCRTLDPLDGARPVAVSLAALWRETAVAWREPTSTEVERQELGGHRCATEGGPARAGPGPGEAAP